MTSRPSTAVPILAVLAIVLPFALYVVGYYWLGERSLSTAPKAIVRVYSHTWQEAIFRPAGRVESWWRGIPVYVGIPDGGTVY